MDERVPDDRLRYLMVRTRAGWVDDGSEPMTEAGRFRRDVHHALEELLAARERIKTLEARNAFSMPSPDGLPNNPALRSDK